MLDNSPLSDRSFANLSSSLWLVFSFSWYYLHRSEFLILMKSSLSFISFMGQAFGILSKKPSLYPGSFMFFPMLSFRSFTVLHFTLRSVIHIEFIFLKGVSSVSRLMFLHVDVQLFQDHFLRELSLPYCIAFASLAKTSQLYLWRAISGLSILFYLSIYFLVLHSWLIN